MTEYFEKVLGLELVRKLYYEPWKLDIVLFKSGGQYIEVI